MTTSSTASSRLRTPGADTEQAGEYRAEREQIAENSRPYAAPQPVMRRVAALAPRRRRPEVPAGDGLRGNGDGIERVDEQVPDAEGDLAGGDGGVGLPRGQRCHQDQHRLQRERAEHQRGPGDRGARDAPPVRAQPDPGAARASADDQQVGGASRGLGDEGAPGRAGNAPVQPQDEGGIQREVDGVGADRDGEGRSGVLQAAQHARARQHGEHRRRAEQADPQVDHCLPADRGRTAERGHDRRARAASHREHHDADRRREPEAVDAVPDGRITAGTELRVPLPRWSRRRGRSRHR